MEGSLGEALEAVSGKCGPALDRHLQLELILTFNRDPFNAQ